MGVPFTKITSITDTCYVIANTKTSNITIKVFNVNSEVTHYFRIFVRENVNGVEILVTGIYSDIYPVVIETTLNGGNIRLSAGSNSSGSIWLEEANLYWNNEPLSSTVRFG